MKRLIIIVEGDTEEAFVSFLLRPFFMAKGIYDVSCYKIKHSKGGLNKYIHLKKDIINSVYETNTVVTTLIDFYGLPKDFPQFEASKKCRDKVERVIFLENAIKEDIQSTQNAYFPLLIPYIQLHEFEALIFSSIIGVERLFEKEEADFHALNNIIHQYPNPEDINDDPKTAPSKRLIKRIKGYNKVVDGVLILDEIGLDIIKEKCVRFNHWLENLLRLISD